MRKDILITAGSSIVSMAIGAAVGYQIAKRRISSDYEATISREIEVARKLATARFGDFVDDSEKVWDENVAELEKTLFTNAVKATRDYSGEDPDDPPFESSTPRLRGPDGKFVKNPAEQAKADLDEAKRTVDQPIVISAMEFLYNELDYMQSSITYFVGDDVLSDERDEVIPEVDRIVGDDNLLRFGERSNDENIVYIRNNNLRHEFEVTKSTGKYGTEVLGLDDDPPRRVPRGCEDE